jgi:hypothetical protein
MSDAIPAGRAHYLRGWAKSRLRWCEERLAIGDDSDNERAAVAAEARAMKAIIDCLAGEWD